MAISQHTTTKAEALLKTIWKGVSGGGCPPGRHGPRRRFARLFRGGCWCSFGCRVKCFETTGSLGAVLVPVIKQTITEIPKGSNYFAEFMRLNKDIVTVTEEGTATTDYPNAVVSAGPLVPPALTVTQDEESRALTFTMSTMDAGFYCNEDDTVHVAILSAGKRMRLLTKELGSRSEGGMATVDVPAYMDGELHVYAYVLTADGKMASDSLYLPLA